MKRFRLEMAQAVRDLLIHLPPPLKRKVKLAFQALAEDPYQAKPLKDELAGLRSFRVMRSRIIFRNQGSLRRDCGFRSKKGYLSPSRD
jgi:mRNA-degrading endonuclease RelE of RelBE toxin-antitoxin system